MLVCCGDVKVGSDLGHIGPKRDKSETFSDQISVHLGSARQFVLKSDLKKYCISPIFVQYDPRGV